MSQLKAFFPSLLRWLSQALKGMGQALRERSVGVLAFEYLELENAFLSLVFGSLVGLPLLPLGVARELAPLAAKELRVMEERHARGSDVISDLFDALKGEW